MPKVKSYSNALKKQRQESSSFTVVVLQMKKEGQLVYLLVRRSAVPDGRASVKRQTRRFIGQRVSGAECAARVKQLARHFVEFLLFYERPLIFSESRKVKRSSAGSSVDHTMARAEDPSS